RRCKFMYAIIETGGKQIKVTEGQEIQVEKVFGETNDTITVDKVLFIVGNTVNVVAPFLEGATVTAKINKQVRDKKLTIFKYKPKKNYSRKQGHRQPFTKLTIDSNNA